MEKEITYYHELIARYFAGELKEEELSELSAWLKANTNNQEIFRNYHTTWEVIEKSKIEAIDTGTEWTKLKSKITLSNKEKSGAKIIPLEPKTSNRNSFFRQTMRIAAVLIVLLGISFIILNYTKPPSQLHLMAVNNTVEGQLPDGTNVTLNTGSTLDYPKKFKGKERTVKLKGEAFFEVTPNTSKPFKISANDIIVEVVGTSFYVNADENGNVEVIVKTGKVAVYANGKASEKMLLQPGEKAEFNKAEQKISEEKNNDENFIAWKTNTLTFSDDSLSNVVETLNKHFKTSISLSDKKLSGLRFTGSYSNKSLEQILTLIESTFKLRVIKKSVNQIELSGYETK